MNHKRIISFLLLAIFLSFFPLGQVCIAEKYEYDFPMAEGYDEVSFEEAKYRGVQDMTNEEKEADYEAFWDILENSYPMYDYLKRHGVNPEALKEQYRYGIYEIYDNTTWMNYFTNILSLFMGSESEAGHLSIVPFGNGYINTQYQSYHYHLENNPEDRWIPLMSTIFANPHVLGLYGLEKEEREPGAPPPFVDVPNNLYTEYSEELDYAYVKINSFMNENPDDDERLLQFFDETEARGIRNVIIDVRGNLGGYYDYWMMNIVAPNIRETLEVDNYGLYQDSPWSEPFLSYYDNNYFFANFNEGEEDEPVDQPTTESASEEEVVETDIKEDEGSEEDEEDEETSERQAAEAATISVFWYRSDEDLPEMPLLNKDDVKSLEKVFIEQFRVSPAFDEPLFTGKFWILSDERSYSASEYFISFAKRTGFAEIVGTESGGDGSCVITLYNALPESGLLLRYNALYGLNADGLNTEEHATIPDVELQAGEDAFNKVLELIAQQ